MTSWALCFTRGTSWRPELLRPAVPRARLLALIASLPPCTIGKAACSGAHHWARLFQAYGHTVRLMAPNFVAPYRMTGKRGKNDAADAAAICEALQRPNMRFVPVKNSPVVAPLCPTQVSTWIAEPKASSCVLRAES